jgi:hypothetical protein
MHKQIQDRSIGICNIHVKLSEFVILTEFLKKKTRKRFW